MKIAIISDTHNHVRNLNTALSLINTEGITTIIHCGDMTSLETAELLRGFAVIFVFGNGDYASGAISKSLEEANPASWTGMVFEGEIDGVKIAAAHGHVPGKVESLFRSAQFDYVFHGHSHRRSDERGSRTRLVNPGALGGIQKETHSFCILDLSSRDLRYIEL